MFESILGHRRPIQILATSLRRETIAQAYLFLGEEGIGKRTVATVFAKALLCPEGCWTQISDSPQTLSLPPISPPQIISPPPSFSPPHPIPLPKGEGREKVCESCRRFERGTHPDLVEVRPEGTAIKIGQIRAIQEGISFPPLVGGRKLYLFDDADRLNLEAANALLKTLEEPPPHAVLILVAHRPHLLPETLRSRCQKVLFVPPSPEELERWLIEKKGRAPEEARRRVALAWGKPGEALTLSEEAAAEKATRLARLTSPEATSSLPDLFAVAEEFGRDPETFLLALRHLSRWLRDRRFEGALEEQGSGVGGRGPDKNPSEESIDRLFDLIQKVHGALHRNINRQIALEVILLELREQMKTGVGDRGPGAGRTY
jgi:DNA polymerase-3 subunit delta'